ncbi:fatty acid desaturase [Sphingomonas rubra]|uniref:Beta-carotene ketolase (CrtW type) n=1 Tax=Sphingomonas rubra TaxID=634430 RepID=A0A1I5QJL2_9SPHN|nr:fatty acid desaturase [Sphingomonas rubra]SFP46423.1 beta-carotene ketolase (CrtW type) [Sphingomonas rubra]
MATAHSSSTAWRARPAQGATGLTLAALVCAGWITLHVAGMVLVPVRWATLPLVLAMAAVQCWLSVGLFIVAHDAMHGSLAPGRPRLNAAIGATLLFLYAGFAWARMRDAHFEHHRAPGSRDDPDFDADHPSDGLRWYATFLSRYFGWPSGLYVCTVVTAYWLLGVPLLNILLLYGLPAIASSVQLFYFGTYRPHRHDETVFDDTHNARSEGWGSWLSLVTCFHFGYHHEHHLDPAVPWWRLPAARRARATPSPGRLEEAAT